MMPFTLTLAINNMNISIRGHKLNIADKLVLRDSTFTSHPSNPSIETKRRISACAACILIELVMLCGLQTGCRTDTLCRGKLALVHLITAMKNAHKSSTILALHRLDSPTVALRLPFTRSARSTRLFAISQPTGPFLCVCSFSTPHSRQGEYIIFLRQVVRDPLIFICFCAA